jgi:RimJ/RimL family protein N-acetyltransferase
MVTKEDLLYRQIYTLKDGTRVLIRPLIKDDRQSLLDLFLPVPLEERRHIRHNINDPDVISSWIDNIDYDKIFPLVAIVGDRIVGDATIHFNEGTARHRAEIRIFLAKDFRERGLGTKLIQGVTEIAKRRNIYILEVQIVRDLINDIKALEKLDFKTVCIFENYFILPDGELRDVVHMLKRIHTPEGEF